MRAGTVTVVAGIVVVPLGSTTVVAGTVVTKPGSVTVVVGEAAYMVTVVVLVAPQPAMNSADAVTRIMNNDNERFFTYFPPVNNLIAHFPG